MDYLESNSNQFLSSEDSYGALCGAQEDSTSLPGFPSSVENGGGPLKRKIEGEENGIGEAKKALIEGGVRSLLPDLDKYWTPVEKDPSDFTAWTQLLQYVDSENEAECAREAYGKFLAKYPYCYGYWKKYADYEKKKGSPEECEKVFRRGLKAISLSVDLWIHYLNYVKSTNEGNLDVIRGQFEAAIETCGLEFRSDKLWEHYIQWERENNNFSNVLKIYDRVLATPTQNYQIHLQNVKELVNQHQPSEILDAEELAELKQAAAAGDHDSLDDEAVVNKVREQIIEKRSEIYKKNEAEITARWTYEEAIKRPYFHVKPLEKGQLKMWKEYLDFEIGKGDARRVGILFERCLIACALYEEYWIKYVRYLINLNDSNLIPRIEDVFSRACTIHHPNKPWINLYWAAWAESRGKIDEAVAILDKVEKITPNSLIIMYRRINMERRRGNTAACADLYERYIQELRNSDSHRVTSVHLAIKYAKFLNKVMGDYEGAKKVLLESLDADLSTKARCVMAIVELGMDHTPIDVDLVLSTFNSALEPTSSLSLEQKVTFVHRKIEFLEDYGSDIESVNKAQDELQNLAKEMRDKKAQGAAVAPVAEAKPEEVASTGAPVAEDKSSAVTTNGSYDQYAYSQQYNQYGNYANWNYQTSSGYGYSQDSWNAYQGYYGTTDSSTGTGA